MKNKEIKEKQKIRQKTIKQQNNKIKIIKQ